MSHQNNTSPFALVILDGFGQAPASSSNAISQAKTPNLDTWLKEYPHTTIEAAGPAVGLPEGYIGNSEVGHLTIGSGRIIEQDLVRINKLIANDQLETHPMIKENFTKLAQSEKTLHLMGLLSDAGVHSHIDHLFAYIDAAVEYGINSIMIHPFLDGRDVPPQSANKYLQQLEKKIENLPACIIASITGRFYAMDRDKNWERTEKVYEMLTKAHKPQWHNWQDALEYYYSQNITDEFIPPTPLGAQQFIQEDDGVLFFNFRPDRARQLTACLTKKLDLAFFITATDYDGKNLQTKVIVEKIDIENTLKEILSKHGKTIFSIAETEKYAHVTYFFNGGKEEALPQETRVLVPSIRTKDYVGHPEMSAAQITNKVIESLRTQPCDFYLINYANADMVGHSGNLNATVQAIEFLDNELKKLYEVIMQMNGTMIITADHGNAEDMLDEKTGQPRTAHTANPVPFIFIQKNLKNKQVDLPLKGLSDIAPFILQQMGFKVPNTMHN